MPIVRVLQWISFVVLAGSIACGGGGADGDIDAAPGPGSDAGAVDAGVDASVEPSGWTVEFSKLPERQFRGQVFEGGAFLASDPTVIRDDDVYRMVYTCVTGADTGGLCEATSTDGIAWALVAGDDPFVEGVVLRSRPGEWDENIETAALVRTADGYELYYSGYLDLDEDGNRPPAALGLATSTDGETFVRASDAPILEPIPGSADGDDIFSAVPFRDGKALRMVYTAWCVDDYHDGLPCEGPPGTSLAGATRDELGAWTRHDAPVLTARDQPSFMASGVAEPTMLVGDDGWFYLFFTGGLGDEPRMTGVARSQQPFGPWDVAPTPALVADPGGFDACGAFAPTVLVESDTVRMWYLGIDDCAGACTSCDFESCGCESTFSIGYAEAPWPLFRP